MVKKINSINVTVLRGAVKYILLAGLVAYTYAPTFVWMADRWMARDSYFGHGFLIPLVTIFWIFKKKDRLLALTAEPSAWGLPILAAGGLVQIVSSVFRIYFVSAFSFIFVLLGLVLFLFGKKIFRQVWYPLVFLVLMIPLPLLVISEVTLRMKFWVAQISAHLINAIGIDAVREGSYIRTPNAQMVVGDPCSGLRSFLAFLCLGLVFAYSEKLSLAKKIFLVLMGFPLAILSNILRVFVLGVLGEIYGTDFTTKYIHDASGFVVFALAFVVFLWLRNLLEGTRVQTR